MAPFIVWYLIKVKKSSQMPNESGSKLLFHHSGVA